MNAQTIITSTKKKANDEFNATKEAQEFCRIFSEIKKVSANHSMN